MLELLIWICLFFGGYILIYLAADIFIDNLKDLCIIYQVSPFIIGLLVLGIDPEESIASIVAAFNGLPYIAVGNVIGNSIFSLTLCFALPALFHKIELTSVSRFYFFILYSCMVTIILSFFFNLGLFIFGIIAIIIYCFYLLRSLKYISREKKLEVIEIKGLLEDIEEDAEELKDKSKKRLFFFVCLSFLLIVLGGELLITSAENLIKATGIPEALFGFIIIAFVTNVEELTLVFKSIKKKSIEIGLGAMIGKIIWNLSLTFGLSGIIAVNILFEYSLLYNWLILLGLILYFNIISQKKSLNWKDGLILLVILSCFIVINIILIL